MTTIEEDLEAALAASITREIDREIIADLRRISGLSAPLLPEINLHIETEVIQARPDRRLRAVWSVEAQQDLMNWHHNLRNWHHIEGDWVAPAAVTQYAKRTKLVKPKPNWKKEGF